MASTNLQNEDEKDIPTIVFNGYYDGIGKR